jgi:uncharacterized membrane protein YeaQ/YmgE (transglycosylase-associated protein family)
MAILLFLLVAALCASIAAAVVPGRIPGGLLAAMISGVLGAWIGGSLVGPVGPTLFGVPLLSTILGSAVFVFGLSCLSQVTHAEV